MNLSNNLKKLRKDRGLSQEGVARRVDGLSRNKLASYEIGIAEPSLCTLYNLSIFYGVTLEQLIK